MAYRKNGARSVTLKNFVSDTLKKKECNQNYGSVQLGTVFLVDKIAWKQMHTSHYAQIVP